MDVIYNLKKLVSENTNNCRLEPTRCYLVQLQKFIYNACVNDRGEEVTGSSHKKFIVFMSMIGEEVTGSSNKKFLYVVLMSMIEEVTGSSHKKFLVFVSMAI